MHSFIKPVIVIYHMKSQVIENQFSQPPDLLSWDMLIARALINDHRYINRIRRRKGEVWPDQSWRQQNQPVHLVRVLTGEKCSHQAPKGRSYHRPTVGIMEEGIQRSHAIFQRSFEIWRYYVREQSPQESCLNPTAVTLQTVNIDKLLGLGHDMVILSFHKSWNPASTQFLSKSIPGRIVQFKV
jgi:hypothetical protein